MRGEAKQGAIGFRAIGQCIPKALKPIAQVHRHLLEEPAADGEFRIIYQHSVLCQTCLPYRNPGDNQRRWTRKNGFLTLELDAGRAFDNRASHFVDVGLPYGPKPRLVLYHLNAEALRTRSPLIELEHSLTGFVKRTLGLDSHGRNIQTVRDQLTRLAACEFRIGKSESSSSITVHARILNGLKLWTPEQANHRELRPTQVQFSPEYFESLMQHAVPLNETAVARLSHNAMALDIYAWLAQRLHRISKGSEARLSWMSLAEQFGAGYAHVREFRRVFKRTLSQVKLVYPDANFEVGEGGMTLRLSRPPVARRLLSVRLSRSEPSP
jgi:Plasmid encoded RepA protein